MVVSHSQHAVNPVFPVNQYDTSETEGQLVVYLSAPILTRSFVPAFNGSIEVDISVKGLPRNDRRKGAKFGKHIQCCYVLLRKFSIIII